MSSDDTWSTLVKVFQKVFDDDVVITEATTAQNVEGWDSLNHVRLIVALEKAFKIRFAAGEVNDLKNVGDLKKRIDEKRAGK